MTLAKQQVADIRNAIRRWIEIANYVNLIDLGDDIRVQKQIMQEEFTFHLLNDHTEETITIADFLNEADSIHYQALILLLREEITLEAYDNAIKELQLKLEHRFHDFPLMNPDHCEEYVNYDVDKFVTRVALDEIYYAQQGMNLRMKHKLSIHELSAFYKDMQMISENVELIIHN